MTFLEFIRKNSLLVLIVIVAIAAGLIMMDYSNQGSAFSRDFHIQVNGTNYKTPDVYSLGENAEQTIQSLVSSTYSKLRARFDANGDEELSTDEQAAMNAWIQEHPEVEASMSRLQYVLNAWCYGLCKRSEENIAINRAMLHEEAKALGIVPSKEQIDSYITGLPAFTKADGTFDRKLYQDLTGYYDGVANNPAEQAFRSVIADIIIWETVGALVTTDVAYNTKSQAAIVDSGNQSMKGKTAWLPADKVQAPAEPTEDELKIYWEANKEKYKSEQRRIVSIYTLTPGKDVTMDAMMNTADVIMQELSIANGSGIDAILENAANNPENVEFTYKNEDGSTHTTLPLSTESGAGDALKAEVDHNGKSTTLAAIAFNDIEATTTVAAYEQAAKTGSTDKLGNIQQMRGFYPTRDSKVVLIKVEAIEQPAVLPFEQARESALADLKAERADNALALAAEKLYKEMSDAAAAGEGTDALFAKAAAAGAEISDFGPCNLGINADLPAGLTTQALLTTATGKLCPLNIQPEGARISTVTERTIPDDPQYTMAKLMYQLPMSNAQLRNQVMLDWLNTAYIRYNVQLAEYVETNTK
ncbi:MAG: SurA N-terminal domain-containing protein [Akkermansia sp.]|nr:SurA N-terminal domain-containing protein [Akkermansia sp.]